MSEEKFETWLKDNADEYHRPPADVPREAMWDAITRARQARPVVTSHRFPAAGNRWALALAASLLISAGIGFGYWMRGSNAGPAPVIVSAPPADSVMRNTTYDVASVAHLTAVESMLTSFRATQRHEDEAALQRLARDLLATTRLLMDSPAGDDAARRQLLADLEYVLAQIVLLDPDAPAEDRVQLDRAIAREQVLTRIRSSIPAGFSRGD
ncbi:MAG TPA: hypothetical protein VFZ73_02985 [Gemmatimonadaceae bacterium]